MGISSILILGVITSIFSISLFNGILYLIVVITGIYFIWYILTSNGSDIIHQSFIFPIINNLAIYLLRFINKRVSYLNKVITWSGNYGSSVSLKYIEKKSKNSFLIVLDVLFIQNDLKSLLNNAFVFINSLDLYNNIKHKKY